MQLPIYQVDTFTDQLFKGNPAAVVPLETWLDDATMQKIASENNLSETAFFAEKEGIYELRWFTPTEEVDLCGHATLAAAFVIHHFINHGQRNIEFQTRSGVLSVTAENGLFTLTFPAKKAVKTECPDVLAKGLGKIPLEVYKADDYLAVFETEEDIRSIKPNFEVLKKVDSRGVIVTSAGKGADFVSRFFAPKIGIPEDPVTGSAHCTLVPFWCEKLNKKELLAQQLSERGGTLYCTDMGRKVNIAGKAVLYFEGKIYLKCGIPSLNISLTR